MDRLGQEAGIAGTIAFALEHVFDHAFAFALALELVALRLLCAIVSLQMRGWHIDVLPRDPFEQRVRLPQPHLIELCFAQRDDGWQVGRPLRRQEGSHFAQSRKVRLLAARRMHSFVARRERAPGRNVNREGSGAERGFERIVNAFLEPGTSVDGPWRRLSHVEQNSVDRDVDDRLQRGLLMLVLLLLSLPVRSGGRQVAGRAALTAGREHGAAAVLQLQRLARDKAQVASKRSVSPPARR